MPRRGREGSKEVADAVRDAVERTIQATVGSAQVTRERAQEAVDELARTAEARLRKSRAVTRRVLGEARPATHEDVQELQAELRALGRRLKAIEDRLPAPAKRKAKPKPKGKTKPKTARG